MATSLASTSEDAVDIVPSREAAKLVIWFEQSNISCSNVLAHNVSQGTVCLPQVEKWLGINSLPALFSSEASTSQEKPYCPGLGLGAQPSAQQQVRIGAILVP